MHHSLREYMHSSWRFEVGVAVRLQVHQILRVNEAAFAVLSERRSAPSSLIPPQAHSLRLSGEAPCNVHYVLMPAQYLLWDVRGDVLDGWNRLEGPP